MRLSLPPTWRQAALGELDNGKRRNIDPGNHPHESFEYYSIPAYQEGQAPFTTKGAEIASTKLLLEPRSVLFGKLNPRVEKVWRVRVSSGLRQIGSTEWLPIVPNGNIDPDFVYFLCWSDQVMHVAKGQVSGSTPSRQRVDPAAFYRIRVPLPPLDEQRKIAAVMSAVQRAMERQERLIALTAELKKALMPKLLTEGTRGESQKQTEIGPVPKSWKVEPLGWHFSLEPSNGLYRPHSDYGRGTLILRIDDFSNDGDIVTTARNRVDAGEADCERFGLAKDDIVLNRVNSLSHLGKTALIGGLDEPMLFESNMMRFRVDEKRLRPAFAFRVLNSAICKSQIVGIAKRAVAQSSVNQGDVGRLLIHLPPDVETQDEILAILNALEAKSAVHVRTQASLKDLFRTLLNQLMTAQIRIHDLDLSALEEAAQQACAV
jgi:type I restriction enzyme S subunit